ncbi:MAG: hypothetical protein V3U11_05705, partial [Planctomycetota bacterium]
MTSPSPRPHILKLLPVILLACTFSMPAALAQNEREIAEAEKRIHRLVNEAEKLLHAGNKDRAEHLLKEARELKKKLAVARQRGRRERGDGGDDFHGLFGNLKEAIGALRELGRKEHAQHLAKFTEDLYADLQRRRPRRERDERRELRERDEPRA